MKLRIVIDTEISKTMAQTLQRSGFTLCPDGSGMQIKIQNSPAITQRKVKVEYITEDQPSTPVKKVSNVNQRQTQN